MQQIEKLVLFRIRAEVYLSFLPGDQGVCNRSGPLREEDRVEQHCLPSHPGTCLHGRQLFGPGQAEDGPGLEGL